MLSLSAISSAVSGRSARNSSACTWLTERVTPHFSPMFPQCSTKRCTASGSRVLVSVISAMTEITVLFGAAVKPPGPDYFAGLAGLRGAASDIVAADPSTKRRRRPARRPSASSRNAGASPAGTPGTGGTPPAAWTSARRGRPPAGAARGRSAIPRSAPSGLPPRCPVGSSAADSARGPPGSRPASCLRWSGCMGRSSAASCSWNWAISWREARVF